MPPAPATTPVVPPATAPAASPHPPPTTAQNGMDKPKVKIAGTTPTAAPTAPPTASPVAAPPAPRTAPPPTADAAVACTPLSDTTSIILALVIFAVLTAFAFPTLTHTSTRSLTAVQMPEAFFVARATKDVVLSLALPKASFTFACAAAVKLLISARFVYAPKPTAPAPVKPTVPAAAPPTAIPQPAPITAPTGMESPKVKSAGRIPNAAPSAPPDKRPTPAPPAPMTAPPPTADAAVTCTRRSDALLLTKAVAWAICVKPASLRSVVRRLMVSTVEISCALTGAELSNFCSICRDGGLAPWMTWVMLQEISSTRGRACTSLSNC